MGKLYMAPMEQLTGFIFRNTLEEMFGGVDAYYSPFITAVAKRVMKTKEQKDVDPNNNKKVVLIPQIMAGSVEQFSEVADTLLNLGYTQINLNAGCPSSTVVAKGKGSGLLRDPDALDRFLEGAFEHLRKKEEESGSPISLSVKTRIGMEKPWEWEDIAKVYNRYPISQLIIHPRYREQFYKGSPDMEVFSEAYKSCKQSIVYNGDIFSVEDYVRVMDTYPDLDGVMIGRGAIRNPAIFRQIRFTCAGGSEGNGTGKEKITGKELREYHDRLYRLYCEDMGNPKDVVYKMKEMWTYMGSLFEDSERPVREIMKSKTPEEYVARVRSLFYACDLKDR